MGPSNLNSSNERLSVTDVEEAIRYAGIIPDTMNNWIQFKVIGETIIIDARRLPQIYVYRYFNVEKREWDMPLLKLAAHLMSDEIIMVKAIFDEKPEGTTLSFFIVVLDGIINSFRNNLMTYLSIIREG